MVQTWEPANTQQAEGRLQRLVQRLGGAPVTLLHLEPGTLFRDRDALWKVCELDESASASGNICATRIASFNVNNTGELMCRDDAPMGYEHYNGYNEAVLRGGIYEVIGCALRSPMLIEQDAILDVARQEVRDSIIAEHEGQIPRRMQGHAHHMTLCTCGKVIKQCRCRDRTGKKREMANVIENGCKGCKAKKGEQ